MEANFLMEPYGSLSDLVISGVWELSVVAVLYGLLFLLANVTQRLSFYKGFLLSVCCFCPFFLHALFSVSWMEFLISFFMGLLPVAALLCARILEITPTDTVFLLLFFQIPIHVLNSANVLLGPGLHFLLLFLVVTCYGRIKYRRMRGFFLRYYMAFIYLSLVTYLFNLICIRAYDLYERHWKGKYLFPLLVIPAVFLLLCTLTCLIRQKLDEQINVVNLWAFRYPRTEKSIYFLTIFTILILLASHIPFVMTWTSSPVLRSVMSIFYLILLILQMMFLVLLYRVAYYKDVLRFKEQERLQEIGYQASLQKNLTSMADIRHDIKNIFLAMGRFVERSDDQEMKDFYSQKIFPFAMEEIEKNYLFSQLYQIPDETLRAFLHMKLYHAHAQKLTIRLKIQIDASSFHLGMDIIDLTRVLGILLDNAFEECISAPDSFVEVQIKNNEHLCTYIVKNTLQAFHTGDDSVRGYTTKSGHSGLGLSIVRTIVELYPFADLNTVSDQHFYIQNLNIRHDQSAP